MPVLPFGEYRPDVADYQGQHSKNILNVVPRGDGYGPFQGLNALSRALPSVCRGMFYARKNDGSVAIFAATSTRLFLMNNSDGTWAPVSKVAAVTSISNASPAVVSYTSHGFSAGDPVVFSTTGTLPTGLTVGTVYYVISSGLTANAFEVSATSGGSAVNTSSAGSGTHSVTTSYSALSSDAQWQFQQFNSLVIAVQKNVPPQVYNLTSSSAFADLGGSPPQASYISIVNRFVVLSGLASPNVYRVQWSGLNATTTWDGTNQSDSQDLADGGIVRGVAGGETGFIFQDSSIRRMSYAPGSPIIFGIDRISNDDGLFAPYSLINAGDRVFFCSPQGFKMLLPGGYPTPIGKERVDRTFFDDVDTANLQLMIAAHDPRNNRVFWAYKSLAGQTDQFDKMLCYDWVLDRWTIIQISGEFITSLAQPGITLENVDNVYGSDIDTITLSSLDNISVSSLPAVSAAGTDHKIAFFSGARLEATMETPEQGGDGRRIFVRGLRPVCDAVAIYGSVSKRENAQAVATYSSETAVNTQGFCPQRVSTRYARGRVRVPAGTAWTFASGIEPDVVLEGGR